MQKKRSKVKKICIMQVVFIMCLAMILNITIFSSNVQAVSQSKRTGIDAFPESYREDLRALQRIYSNWTFTAFYTGISWNDFLNGECSPIEKNTIPDEKYKAPGAGTTDPGFWCASREAIAHYADPRNFLNEQGIFQFMEMSYNPSVHNKQGVENILRNTFMDRSITVSAEREDNSVKAKQEESRIIVAPEAKNTEVAVAIGRTNFEVKNREGRVVSADSKPGTGYTFRNKQYNTEYTIVVLGDVYKDSEITASDYVKIKNYLMGKNTLSNTEKKAADVDCDGEITASDYVRIKNYLMGRLQITLSSKTTATSTMRYSDIIMKAAEESGISPYSIAIKIIQEVGRQGSGSTSGTYPGYEGYYNFFNWGASDKGNDGRSAVEKGLIFAKGKGWNNQYTSIVEGAKMMANNYVSIGQNTSYFYKFNVIDNGKHALYNHQYMSNIMDPSTQAANLFTTYAQNGVIESSINFIIPVYDNMPSDRCPKIITDKPTDPNARYIDATDVALRTGAGTGHDIITRLSNCYVIVERFNAGDANGETWAYVRTLDGKTKGYITQRYFKNV